MFWSKKDIKIKHLEVDRYLVFFYYLYDTDSSAHFFKTGASNVGRMKAWYVMGEEKVRELSKVSSISSSPVSTSLF